MFDSRGAHFTGKLRRSASFPFSFSRKFLVMWKIRAATPLIRVVRFFFRQKGVFPGRYNLVKRVLSVHRHLSTSFSALTVL